MARKHQIPNNDPFFYFVAIRPLGLTDGSRVIKATADGRILNWNHDPASELDVDLLEDIRSVIKKTSIAPNLYHVCVFARTDGDPDSLTVERHDEISGRIHEGFLRYLQATVFLNNEHSDTHAISDRWDTMDKEDRRCMICLEGMTRPGGHGKENLKKAQSKEHQGKGKKCHGKSSENMTGKETPSQFPECGHILGRDCLERYIDGSFLEWAEGKSLATWNPLCPYCRTGILSKELSTFTVREARLRRTQEPRRHRDSTSRVRLVDRLKNLIMYLWSQGALLLDMGLLLFLMSCPAWVRRRLGYSTGQALIGFWR